MNGPMSPVPADHPLMKAWEAFKATPEFGAAKQWAAHPEHLLGSLWAMFDAGWRAGVAASHGMEPIYTAPSEGAQPSGETMEQREQVCAAWCDLPDDLRKDPRLTRLYRALGGPRMDEPSEADASTKDPANG